MKYQVIEMVNIFCPKDKGGGGQENIWGTYVEKSTNAPWVATHPIFLLCGKKIDTFSTTHPLNFHNFDFYHT